MSGDETLVSYFIKDGISSEALETYKVRDSNAHTDFTGLERMWVGVYVPFPMPGTNMVIVGGFTEICVRRRLEDPIRAVERRIKTRRIYTSVLTT